jgi:hypothetical protein
MAPAKNKDDALSEVDNYGLESLLSKLSELC